MIAAMGAVARTFFVCGFVLFSCFAFGQDMTKDQKPKDAKDIAVAYMLGEPDRLLKEFADAQDELAKAKAEPVRNLRNERAKASYVADRQKQVLDLEKKLAEAKGGDISIPELLTPYNQKSLDDCGVGKMGTITLVSAPYYPRMEAKIYQILDKKRMLVRLEQQFYDYRAELQMQSKIVLAMMPTDGHTDDQKLSFDRPVVVSGTYQYKTAVGTSTVLVFEQIDPAWLKAEAKTRLPSSTVNRIVETLAKAQADKAEADKKAALMPGPTMPQEPLTGLAKVRAEKAKAEADKQAAALKAETDKRARAEADAKAAAEAEETKWRTWTDSTGQFTTKAKFGGMASGKVNLIKKDGSKVSLPLANLSDEDQKWIEAAAHEPVAKPAVTRDAPIAKMKDPSVRTVDDVKAFFLSGIPRDNQARQSTRGSKRSTPSTKGKANRVYTVGELESRFGPPNERSQGHGSSKAGAKPDIWTYNCVDGSVKCTFIEKGYGAGDAASTLRLQIREVSDHQN